MSLILLCPGNAEKCVLLCERLKLKAFLLNSFVGTTMKIMENNYRKKGASRADLMDEAAMNEAVSQLGEDD